MESMMSPLQNPAPSQTDSHEEEFCQVSVMSGLETPCEDWPSALPTTLPAHDSQAGFSSGVYELLETNPWL